MATNPALPIFIDIDGTLTADSERGWGAVFEDRLGRVREIIRGGTAIVLWSGRGGDYAIAFATKYGLQDAICLGKPSRIVDDNPTLRPGLKVESPDAFFKS